MENLISVIVCTYNQESTIARTLDSILMQQCHVPVEIIIGEDCSTDGTRTICQKYAAQHPQITLIANERNKGIVDNYFDCLLACRGQYIADCAGDDFWCNPLKLEKEVTIMETHPEVTLVHTNWVSYNEATGQTTPSPKKPFEAPFTPGETMLEAIVIQLDIPVIHLCTSLYRTDIIVQALLTDEAHYRDKEFGCEDLQIAFLMAQQGTIAYLPDVTLNYSQGGETVSYSADYHKQFRFTMRVSRLSHLLAQRHNIHSEATQRYFQRRIYALGMHAFRAHDSRLFTETLKAEREWQCRRPLHTRVLFLVMRHPWPWSTALFFRKIIVSAKQALH